MLTAIPTPLMRKVPAAGPDHPASAHAPMAVPVLFTVDVFKADIEKLLSQPHKAEAARTLTDEERAMGRKASLVSAPQGQGREEGQGEEGQAAKGGRARHAAAP